MWRGKGPHFGFEQLRCLWFLPTEMPINMKTVHFSRSWLCASVLGTLFSFGFQWFRSVYRWWSD